MRYIIDGYNLLHATGHLSGKVGGHVLEWARKTLLSRLATFVKAGAGGVTVVFDARKAPPSVAPEQNYQGVHVFYALKSEADDLIEELILDDAAPQFLTVVSDDRRLREAARRRHCPTQSCLDFYDETEKPPRTPLIDEPKERPPTLSENEVRAWLKAFGADEDD